MSNAGNVGFFEKYTCASFFAKIKNKCFIFSDVKKMADEYEENITKVSEDCSKTIKEVKDSYKETIDELNEKIESLQLNLKDSTELHNRANATKEKVIEKLNEEITSLRAELKNKDKEHAIAINNLTIENSSKLNRIKTECADALLKADKKNNKVKQPKAEEEKEATSAPVAIPELPVLEDETEKKQKARTGVSSFSLEQIAEIKRRRKSGEKVVDIAADLGVHKSTINRALKK